MIKRSVAALCCFALVLGLSLLVLLYEPKTSYCADTKRFICIINPESRYYWGNMKEGISQADLEFGTSTKFCSFDRFDLDGQLLLLEEAAYVHTDGIITVGEPFSDQFNEKVRELTDEGIPVVLLDTDSKECGRSCYIGSDNYLAGRTAALQIIEETGGHARIAIIITGMDDANQRERLNGFRDAVADCPDVEILEICETHLDKNALQEDLKRILTQYDDLNALFCAEAWTSQQTGLALENLPFERDLAIVGFDITENTQEFVRDGRYCALIVQDSFSMGYQAVDYLERYASGVKNLPTEIFTDVFCVTRENIDSYAEWSKNGS